MDKANRQCRGVFIHLGVSVKLIMDTIDIRARYSRSNVSPAEKRVRSENAEPEAVADAVASIALEQELVMASRSSSDGAVAIVQPYILSPKMQDLRERASFPIEKSNLDRF